MEPPAPTTIKDLHEELVFIPSVGENVSLESRIYHGRGRKKEM
jgi:hypothetical protein